jgi:hypothetical protein
MHCRRLNLLLQEDLMAEVHFHRQVGQEAVHCQAVAVEVHPREVGAHIPVEVLVYFLASDNAGQDISSNAANTET